MKKILIGLVAFTSITAFASDCRIHFSPHEQGDDYPSATSLASKMSKKMKKNGIIVVKKASNANVGLVLKYKNVKKEHEYNNGPYGLSSSTEYSFAVEVSEYRDGGIKSRKEYSTLDPEKLSQKILTDIKCL